MSGDPTGRVCVFEGCDSPATRVDYNKAHCDEHANRGRWTRPDGTFDVLAYCRALDDAANASVGAGPPR